MAKANTSQEPSMEDILASIRRIISDDTAPKPGEPAAKAAPVAVQAAPAARPAGHVSEDDLDRLFAQADGTPEPDDDDGFAAIEVEEDDQDDVLELTDEAAVEDDTLDLVEGFGPDEADVAFVDPPPRAPDPAPAPPPRMETPAPERPQPQPQRAAPVVDPVEDDEEVSEEPLVSARTSASVNAAFGSLTHTILSNNAKTLDDLVKEMLRPMLKAWLDENLPVVVERMVRAEIERVSRGR